MSKTALVLGATGGIGEAVAIELAKNGYNIAIHYASNEAKATELAAKLNPEVKSIAVKGDVADEAAMTAVFNQVKDAFGTIDAIVNTAGIMRLAPISSLDMDEFDAVMRTNVRGTFVVSKLATSFLNEAGVLINFSTSVTRTQFVNYGAYAAAKAAIESLTLVLARELRGKNIRVNTIAPGPTATPLFLEGKTEEQIKGLSMSNPLERLGTPEDIAEAVQSVVNAQWINGQTIFVNGGMI